MLAEVTQWILEAVRSHGVLGVVLGVFLETVFTPIPSPIVLMTAGLVLIEPELVMGAALLKILLIITLPAAIAQTIGNYGIYAIAYHGGKPVIDKSKKMLGFSWKDILRVKKRFRIGSRSEAIGKEDISLFFLRAIPIVPLSVVSALAGILKVDWKRFGLFSFLGLIPRNFLLAFIGWKMSRVYLEFARQIDSVETLLTITLIGLVVGIILVNKLKLFDRIEHWVTK
ncbi:MAG: VTT domain-containing protein [Candidatus Woesearchaeota archaeon]